MRKIPTIFIRDDNDRRFVTSEPHPDCAWVFAGDGVPTRKYDGTCVRFDGSRWWARREVRAGRPAPAGFVPVESDGTTGKTVGWEPMAQSPFARFHAEAAGSTAWAEGTYELVGPKINGNPEGAPAHRLIAHATAEPVALADRTFEAIRAAVLGARASSGCEGIVFHAADGRMAKVKARDFCP